MLNQIMRLIQQRINIFRYKCLAAKIQRPSFLRQQLQAEGYYSQCGQDKWIMETILPGRRNGVFVDIGAHDGITFSNTYLLEKVGWTGLAIEPMPDAYKTLTENRQCMTVNGCIAPSAGKESFRIITGSVQMLSGLVKEYDPRHLKRIKKELAIHGGEYKDIEVDCYNLNDLLKHHKINQIDYLSIDVEGVELKILNEIDFNCIKVLVIGVENNYSDYRIPSLLIRKGFEFHSLVGDEFYVNRLWFDANQLGQ